MENLRSEESEGDDDGFGDFKFVATTTNHHVEEDEWGDFVDLVSLSHSSKQISFQSSGSFLQEPIFSSETSLFVNPANNLLVSTNDSDIRSSKNGLEKKLDEKWVKPKGAIPLSIFGDDEEELNDTQNFDTLADGFSVEKVTNGFKTGPKVGLNDLIENLYRESNAESGVNSSAIVRVSDSDDNSWEFQGAFTGNGIEDVNSDIKSTHGEQTAGAKMASANDNEISNVMKGSDVDVARDQHNLIHPFISENGFSTLLNISVEDGVKNGFISAIASPQLDESEHMMCVNGINQPSVHEFEPAWSEIESNFNKEVDFDENCWEFKDALSDFKVKDENLDAQQISSKTKYLANFQDFYLRLKEQACFLACQHLASNKDATFSGKDMKIVMDDKDFQAIYERLWESNMSCKETCFDEHQEAKNCFDKLLEDLRTPGFDFLELEYKLSSRISLALKDLSSAVALFDHAVLILSILNLTSQENLASYLDAWAKLVSACSQELQHGANIWKQASNKNLHKNLLFDPRGKQYLISLGEVYRVAQVLRITVKLYRPWLLLNSNFLEDIHSQLEESSAAWFDSGLKNNIASISKQENLEDEGAIKCLLESIDVLLDLDPLEFRSDTPFKAHSVCGLSLLPLSMLPDMTVVEWNGERYFLKLLNLWINRISSDPSLLPILRDG